MWIGTDDKGCCHNQIESAMCIGMDVTGSFLNQFEVLCGLEQMRNDNVITQFAVIYG
jgi:hypothetical protein